MGNFMNASKQDDAKSVLPSHLGGGPMNLGDPDDRTLRSVEKKILILNLARESIHLQKCHTEAQVLDKCGGDAGLLAPFKCRKERDDLVGCSKHWFYNEDFINECTEEYLRRRSYFRRTGKPGHLYSEEGEKVSGTSQNVA